MLKWFWGAFLSLVRSKRRFPNATVTIALQEESLDVVEWKPREIARRLALYGDAIDRVILDPSAGCGKPIKIGFTRRTYEEIERLLPCLGLVAAGALHADNVEDQLSELLRQFELSTDAESKLRVFPADLLDVQKAIRYVQTTDALLRKYETHRKLQPVN